MRAIECIILEKEGSINGLCPHLDAHGQKSVKHCILMPENKLLKSCNYVVLGEQFSNLGILMDDEHDGRQACWQIGMNADRQDG